MGLAAEAPATWRIYGASIVSESVWRNGRLSHADRTWATVKPSEPHTIPSTDYNEIMNSDAGVGKWTSQIVC